MLSNYIIRDGNVKPRRSCTQKCRGKKTIKKITGVIFLINSKFLDYSAEAALAAFFA